MSGALTLTAINSSRCADRVRLRVDTSVLSNRVLRQVVRLSNGEVILDEELYEDFEKNYKCTRTAHGTHHFHIMEFDDFIAGGSCERTQSSGYLADPRAG